MHEGITWFSNQQVPTENQIVGIGGKVGFDDPRSGDRLYETESCKLGNCDDGGQVRSDPCLIPNIDFGPSWTQQGAFLYILGCGFSALNEFVLILPASNLQVPLQIQEVYSGLVSATVPKNIAAVDQNAFLMVRNKNGSPSNHWPLDFKSLKEVKRLPPERIKVVYCSDSADYNYCNDAFSVDQNICCVFDSTGQANPVASFASISSYHYTDGSLIGDEGGDFYQVELAPGWELHDIKQSIQILNGGGWVGDAVGFIQGANSATIFVPWSVGGNSGATYYIDIWAIGPKGTDP